MRTSGRRLVRYVSLSLIVMLSLSAHVIGQENQGNIYGKVVDQSGAPVSGATATLTGEVAPQETTTDSAGRFQFLAVDPGRYAVTVTHSRFAAVTYENVSVTLSRSTDLTVTLNTSGVQETVTVSDVAPLIDPRKTETGATFYREELQQIPTARDIWAVIQMAPGVLLDTVNVAGNTSGSQPNFTAKGSNQSTYILDGVTVTDNSYGAFAGRQNGASPSYFDFDTFEEVAVTTGGSSLDLQTPGVTINIVTKRGTNDFKGSARFFHAPDEWESDNKTAEANEQGLETDSIQKVQEYGIEAGGPILKDRLWVWGAIAKQEIERNRTFEDFFGDVVNQELTLEPWNAKVNAQISSSNAASFFYSRSDRTELKTGEDTGRAPDTYRNLLIDSDLFKFEDSHVFSPDFFGNFNLSYLDADYDHSPIQGQDEQVLYDEDGIYHRGYLYLRTTNPQIQGNLTASKFFTTGSVGHELKFSFGYRNQENESASAWPGDQVIASEFSGFALITRGVKTVYENDYIHATLGDTLTLGNFTINAGVRYQYQRGRNLASSAGASGLFPDLLPAVEYEGDSGYPFKYDDLLPRISATYALGKEKRTLLKASYSRFADQLGAVTYRLNGLPITSGFYYYWDDVNGNHRVERNEVDLEDGFYSFYNVDPTTLPNSPNAVADNFDTPLTDEIILGMDHQLLEDLAVSVAYTYRYYDRLQDRVPIGSDPSTWRLVRNVQTTRTAANGFTINIDEPYYFLNLPTTPTGDIFINRPGASQTFHGGEIQLVKRLRNRWMLRGNFAYNDWTQNVSAESIYDPNNEWGTGAPNEDGGIAVGYARGTIWVHSRWQFNVSGLYQLPWDVNFGMNFFGREGYPAGYYYRSPIDRLTAGRHRPVIGKLDDHRLDDVFQLDLRLEKAFAIGPVTLTPSVDVFNVLNENAVIQRENRVGDATATGFNQYAFFNDIVELQSPRIVRAGFRVSF